MPRSCVFLLAALFLVAAGDPAPVGEIVEKDGLKIIPAATDEIRDAIALPVWKGKVEKPAEESFVELLVTGEGKSWVEGKTVDLKQLTERLVAHAEPRRMTDHPCQPSLVPLLVRAAKDLEWTAVRQAIRCARHMDVRMWRVWFAMVTADGKPVAVPVFLPIDPRTPGTERPTVRLRLDHPRGSDKTRVLVDDAETGRGYMGFAMAEDRLAKRLAADPGLEVLIDGREKVPYGEVMKALRLVRKVGIERVNFDWGPPPGEQMLEEPEEVVIPESRELAERMGCLPLVQRGKIRVWPAAEPAERRALRLPDLPGDTPLSTKAHQEEELFELLVDRKGLFRIGGKHADMKELLKQLLIRAETRRDEDHPKKISHAAILIHAPREVRWREIQWAMLAAASPDVRIYRLYFATRAPDGSFAYVPVFLPAEYAVPADPRILRLELKRKRTETVTRLSLLGDACGEGESGFETLRKKLPELRKERPERSIGELYGWASVPYQDAVRGIAAFHAAGVTRIQFVGPPPRSRRK